jgi:hypothetical protein
LLLLVFVFAGVGFFILGALVLLGLVVAGFTFSWLLAVLVPLAIVWIFIAATRTQA